MKGWNGSKKERRNEGSKILHEKVMEGQGQGIFMKFSEGRLIDKAGQKNLSYHDQRQVEVKTRSR